MRTVEIKIVLKYLYLIACIICMGILTVIPSIHTNNSLCISVIPIILSMYIVIKKNEFIKKINLFAILFSIMFVIMLSFENVIREFIEMPNMSYYMVLKVLFFPLIIISAYTCFFDFFDNEVAQLNNENKITKYSLYGICKPTWITAAVAIFFLLAYFPGDINNDIPSDMLSDVHVYSDWHTIGFDIFLRMCAKLFGSMFGVTLIQTMLFIIAINYATKFLIEQFNSLAIGYIYAIANCFIGIMQYRYMVNMCKDINFYIFMMCFSVSILKILHKGTTDVIDYVFLAVFGFFASIFRHMALPIVIITLLILIAYFMKKKKTKEITRCSICLIIIALCNITFVNCIGFGIFKAEKNPEYVKFSIPMNMIGSMAYRYQYNDEILPEDVKNVMEQIMPIEKWADCYSKYDSDAIGRPWHKVGDDILKLNDRDNQLAILKLNWFFLKSNPKAYVISFFDINSIVWEIGTPDDGLVYSIRGSDRYEYHRMNKGASFDMIEQTMDYIENRPILVALVMRGGMSLLLLLAYFAYLLINKDNSYLGIIPILLYSASLFISIPQNSNRYIMPIVGYAILFGTYIYGLKKYGLKESKGEY